MNTELLHDEVMRRAKSGDRIPDVIEIVRVLGHPADMRPLADIPDRFGIGIVEDTAESHGASWRDGSLAGRHVRAARDLGCSSFNGSKIITTGCGGMIVTDDAELATRAKHLTTQAKMPGSMCIHHAVGYNCRLSDLAAVGVAQLERLEEMLEGRHRIARRHLFPTDLKVMLAPDAMWADPTYWLDSDTCRGRDRVLTRSSPGWRVAALKGLAALHEQPT